MEVAHETINIVHILDYEIPNFPRQRDELSFSFFMEKMQPIGVLPCLTQTSSSRHARSQDLLFLDGPKNSKVLLFPYREICTHRILHMIPIFTYQGILLAANPIFFLLLSKAAYTPCGIMTNHCRIVLLDIHLILRQLQFDFDSVFTTASVKTPLSLPRLLSFFWLIC
jgi:hypothetical protein